MRSPGKLSKARTSAEIEAEKIEKEKAELQKRLQKSALRCAKVRSREGVVVVRKSGMGTKTKNSALSSPDKEQYLAMRRAETSRKAVE